MTICFYSFMIAFSGEASCMRIVGRLRGLWFSYDSIYRLWAKLMGKGPWNTRSARWIFLLERFFT